MGRAALMHFWHSLSMDHFQDHFHSSQRLPFLEVQYKKNLWWSAKGSVTVAVDADVVVGAQQQHQPICCGFRHHDANQQERQNIGEESEVVTLTSG